LILVPHHRLIFENDAATRALFVSWQIAYLGGSWPCGGGDNEAGAIGGMV
jgi:hypothetical protein